MEDLDFTNSELDQEARLLLVREFLQQEACLINFTKVDGSDRSMICTLNESLMDVATRVVSEDVVDVPKNSNVITVWSVENSAWRAIRVMSIKTVKRMPVRWTITVEEDPETGELFFPLPTELLKLQGWSDGDMLEWEDLGDGSWAIKKL